MDKEKRISIKKLNKELSDHIIKVIPNAIALIIRKELKVESKEPVWFKSFRLEMQDFKNNQEIFNKNQEIFNKEMISFKENVIKRLDKLENYHK